MHIKPSGIFSRKRKLKHTTCSIHNLGSSYNHTMTSKMTYIEEDISPHSLQYKIQKKKNKHWKHSHSYSQVYEVKDTSIKNTEVPRNQYETSLPDYSKIIITSSNALWAWQQILLLKYEERLFTAAKLISEIKKLLLDTNLPKDLRESLELKLEKNATLIQSIERNAASGEQALNDFDNEESSSNEWHFAHSHFGIKTYWKPGVDGNIWFKTEGIIEDVNIFHTLAVIQEVDLYYKWLPFCKESVNLYRPSRVEVISYLIFSAPFIQRDCLLQAFGINACHEKQCVLLIGGSIDESTLASNIRAPKLSGGDNERLEIAGFRALIQPYNRQNARMCIVANINPKCAVPKPLLNAGIKQCAGILLYLVRKEAKKIDNTQSSLINKDNTHLCRITEDPNNFYCWLRPLVDAWIKHYEQKLSQPVETYARSARQSDSNGIVGAFRNCCDSWPINNHEKSGDAYLDSPVLYYEQGANQEYGITKILILLMVFLNISINRDPFLLVACVKLIFTCSCAWAAIPIMLDKIICKHTNLQVSQQFIVVAAIAYDCVSSFMVYAWALYGQQPLPSTLTNETPIQTVANILLIAISIMFAVAISFIDVAVGRNNYVEYKMCKCELLTAAMQ